MEFKILFFVYHALYDDTPEYVRDMLEEKINVQALRSTVSSQLAIPQSRLKGFWDHAFSIVARIYH